MDTNARRKKIIRELSSSNGLITGEYLAGILGVSSRTVRNDIKAINEELMKCGAEIVSVPGTGYTLKFSNDNNAMDVLRETMTDNSDYIVPTIPSDRVKYIIGRLLSGNGYITLESLADELYVSKSTVENDMSQVEKWFAGHNMKLFKKTNYGIKLLGGEKDYRFALSDYLEEAKENNEQRLNSAYAMDKIVSSVDIDKIKDIIDEVHKDMPFTMTDVAYTNLVFHIAVAVKRIKEGKSVELPQADMNQLRIQKEYHIARAIAERIENVFNVDIPEAEVGYISIHLMGTKVLTEGQVTKNRIIDTLGEDIYDAVIKMVNSVKEAYGLDFSKDEELIYGLALHLKPTINRIKYGMNLKNPLLNEIKEEYPQAFEMAITASKVIEECFGIAVNENEMGYIAMYFGAAIERGNYQRCRKISRIAVVCASGMGTAQLLAARVRRVFPHITITGVYSSLQKGDIERGNPDIILSTVPISGMDVQVVKINPIPDKSDMERLKSVILSEDMGTDADTLIELFSRDLFLSGINVDDRFEVIDIMSDTLYEKGYVDKEFKQSAKERERISSTSIGNLVAIPHAMLGHALESHIAVGILEKPIKWGNSRVQLVFMIALKKMSDREFQDVFDALYKVVSNRTVVASIIKANDFDRFVNILKGRGSYDDK